MTDHVASIYLAGGLFGDIEMPVRYVPHFVGDILERQYKTIEEMTTAADRYMRKWQQSIKTEKKEPSKKRGRAASD